MANQKSVALLIETSNSYARGLLRGIASFIHEKGCWSVYLAEQERGAAPPRWLQDWHGDGVIARIENTGIADAIRPLTIPVIDVSAARHLPELPCVETDDKAIAEMAYTHLRERGFESLAFYGDESFAWSCNRQHQFAKRAATENIDCSVFTSKQQRRHSPALERQRLTDWLRGLPKPVGLFACYDKKAQEVLDVCRECKIAVPTEIAVLGTDNDDLLCDLCTPPLSSVIPAAEQTGRKAAEMLDQLMRKRKRTNKANGKPVLISPIGVNTRQSTDVVAIADPEIALAVRYIRDHYDDGINVKDLLGIVPLSRRVLESRFRDILGRTPHEEITRRRLDRVRALLRSSDLKLSMIADQAGFQNQEYMSVAFRRDTGVAPGQYRRQNRVT